MKSYTGVGGSMEEKEAGRKGSLGSKAEGGDTTVVERQFNLFEIMAI